MTIAAAKSPRAIVACYYDMGLHPVFWSQIGDDKHPRRDGWQTERQTLDAYHDGNRVGIFTGTEVSPGRFVHDTDVDWGPGAAVAQKLLPASGCIFGHASKPISHCFYTLPEALPRRVYKDPIDDTMLIELRGTTQDGRCAHQTMVPPSTWSKDGKQEPLIFQSAEGLSYVPDADPPPRRHRQRATRRSASFRDAA